MSADAVVAFEAKKDARPSEVNGQPVEAISEATIHGFAPPWDRAIDDDAGPKVTEIHYTHRTPGSRIEMRRLQWERSGGVHNSMRIGPNLDLSLC